MEQGPNGPLPVFKSRMDFFIGRSVKIHGTDPKLNAPVVQLLPDLSSYDNLQNEGTLMIISLGILARNEQKRSGRYAAA